MTRIRRLLAASAAMVLSAACIGEPSVANVTLSVTAVSLDAIGATAQLSASVTDQDGNPLTDEVSWTSSASGVATVTSAGLVTAVGNGSATITATAGGRSSTASVSVAQVVTTLAKTAGDAQTGAVAAALANPATLQARDRLNQPVAGATIAFAVTAGGGSVSATSATTNASGDASTNWTLGTVAGAAQSLTSTAGAASVVFSATATAGPGDSLTIVAGNNQTGSPSSALPDSLRVRVSDAFGNDVPGAVVTWAVTSGGGSVSPVSTTTGANGLAKTQWTLGPTFGSQTATASNATVTVGSPAQFTATAGQSTMTVNDGDNQEATVSTATVIAPSVKITAPGGGPVAGVTVTFAVTAGGGSVGGGTVVTDAQGIARVGSWTLGPTPGTNTLSASTTDPSVAAGAVVFTANGLATGYDIVLRYLTTVSATVRAAFDSAEARWQRVITGDLPNVAMNVASGQCGSNQPALNETVDDLLIFVTVEAIDGPGGVLGSAGPCFIRTTGSLSIVGRMRFDEADLTSLETSGRLQAVILHEMGHVVGIGTLWNTLGFLQNPSLPSSPGVDTHFNGPKAIAAFDTLGGTNYTGGAKVPVENNAAYGAGTRDGHWREDVFDHELMTGIVEAMGVAMPMSKMTIASLEDMGYATDRTQADTYTHTFSAPPALRAAQAGQIVLMNDITLDVIRVVDSRGRVVRVIVP